MFIFYCSCGLKAPVLPLCPLPGACVCYHVQSLAVWVGWRLEPLGYGQLAHVVDSTLAPPPRRMAHALKPGAQCWERETVAAPFQGQLIVSVSLLRSMCCYDVCVCVVAVGWGGVANTLAPSPVSVLFFQVATRPILELITSKD